MKILIILNQPYPAGMACTKRIHLYAKGLQELGNEVKIIIPKPKDKWNSVANTKISGVYDGINFEYGSKTTIRSNRFFLRRYHDFNGIINTFILSLKYNPEIIIVTGESLLQILIIKLVAIIKKSILIRERSEVPLLKKEKLNLLDIFSQKIIYSFFDGIIVISKELNFFFKSKLKFKGKILEIPIISEKKNNIVNDNIVSNKFVYTGSLIDKKDGIIILLKAFAIFSKKHPDIKLLMSGVLNHSKDKDKIMSCINELGIKDNVEFIGYVSEKELNIVRNSALALLLAKPVNRQNKYNMATKVAEYLFTGRPIIISNVDPSTTFLKHGENALIVPPKEEFFADQMKFVVDNIDVANKIGQEGKIIAEKLFNYKYQTKRLEGFLYDI